MIHARELRIGNCIKDANGKIRFVNHRIISDIASAPERHGYEPIPLHHEWLNKLGIKFGTALGYGYSFAENFNVYLTQRPWGSIECTIMQYSEGDEILKHIEFVHQFQNLYYAIVGEELEVHNLV